MKGNSSTATPEFLGRRRQTYLRDGIIIAALVFVTAALTTAFDVVDKMASQARGLHPFEVEELLLAFVVLSGALAWFSMRWLRAGQDEARRQARAEVDLSNSAVHWRSLFEHAREVISVLDEEGTILSVNRTLGDQARDEVEGSSILEYTPPDQHQATMESLRQVFATGEPHTHERRVTLPNGGGMWVGTSVAPVKSNGKVTAVTVITEDLTDRKRSEEALREAQSRLAAVVNNVPIMVFDVDQDGIFTLSEGKGPDLLSRKPGEVVGQSIFDVYRDVPPICDAIRAGLEGRPTSTTVELGGLAFEAHYAPVTDDGGEVSGVFGMAYDVTDRKRAEEALADKTEQLQAITHAMMVFLESGDLREASSQLLRSALAQTESEYGFVGAVTEGPVLRILAHEGIVWDERVNRQFYDEALSSYREAGYLEFTNLDNLFGAVITSGDAVVANDPGNDPRAGGLAPGHPPLRHFLGVPIYKASEVVGMIGVANRPGGYTGLEQAKIDTLTRAAGVLYDSYRRSERESALEAERRRAEEALREALSRLAAVVNNVPIIVFDVDREGIFTLSEGKGLDLLSRKPGEVVGQSIFDVYRDVPPICDAIRAGLEGRPTSTTVELGGLAFEAHYVPVTDAGGEVTGLFGMAYDITERRRAEEALLQAKDELEARVAERTSELRETNQQLRKELLERTKAEGALRDSEARISRIAEQSKDMIYRFRLGPERGFEFVSAASQEIFGYTPEEYYADPDLAERLLRPEIGARYREFVSWPEQGEGLYIDACIRKDGKEVWVENHRRMILDDLGNPVATEGIVRNVTKRTLAERALAESEERFRLLAENAQDLIFRWRRGQGFEYLNPACEAMLGYKAEEFMNDPSLLFRVTEEQHEPTLHAGPEAYQPGTTKTDIVSAKHKDGRTVFIELQRLPIYDEAGEMVAVEGNARDIGERVQAEREIRAMSRRLVQAQEMERRHVARELHDEIGQSLTGLRLALEAVERHQEAKTPNGNSLAQAQSLVEGLMKQVSALSLDLRPSMLDDLGLVPALAWLVDRQLSQNGVRVDFDYEGLSERFPMEVETAVYRIAQEALTNVARHSGVKRATLNVSAHDEVIDVTVTDAGRGFDDDARTFTSSGLHGMRERARLLGGELDIESELGKSTRVHGRIPLNA